MDSPLLSSFDGETAVHLWRDCCEAAIKCCHKIVQRFRKPDANNNSQNTGETRG
jgi:hypothetical protein